MHTGPPFSAPSLRAASLLRAELPTREDEDTLSITKTSMFIRQNGGVHRSAEVTRVIRVN